MSANPFTQYGGVKPYVIILSKEHKYTTMNLLFEEANAKYPKHTVTLPEGRILWCQETPFTLEQLHDLKKEGFPYQWGFGPCCETIPSDKVKLGKLELLEL